MRHYRAGLILVATLVLGGMVQAQNCYVPVGALKGIYNLSTNATVSCPNPLGLGNGSCTISQGVVATPSLGEPSVQSGCTGFTEGSLKDTIVSSTMNDVGVFPCGNGQSLTETYVGTSGVPLSTLLTIDTGKGSYTFYPEPYENATETLTGCSSGSGTGTPAMFPITNWPQTFTLPSTVQALTVNNFSFNGGSVLPVPNVIIPWTFSLTLAPNYECEPCKQRGGAGLPVSSSISVENQSLGEDVPIVGTGFILHYEGSRTSGGGGTGAATADAMMIGGWTLNVHHAYDFVSNTLYLGDGSHRSGYELGTPLLVNGQILISSRDGKEAYAFSLTTGLHVETVRLMTGAVKYTFGYDSANKLITITDATGNVTSIQRNAAEQPTAIVSPYGQTTTLTVDNSGFLSKVTDPLSQSASFVNTSMGQLTSRTDENGNIFTYTYDSNGRLEKDSDPLGGYTAVTRTDATSGFGWTIGETTSMGRTSSYQSVLTLPWLQDGTATESQQHTNIWPNGLQASSSNSLQNGQLTNSASLPDGTSDSQTLGPDPVWGRQVPVLTSETIKQGSLTMNVTGSRSTTLGTAGNPFSVTTLTDTQTVNGRSYTSVFTGSPRTYVLTTPVGRTVTVGVDSLERMVSTQITGLAAVDLGYDKRGRIVSVTHGARKSTYTYNTDGFLASVTDPLQLTTSFSYDADGQPLSTTLPDGRVISYAYDGNGNLASVTPPGKPAHTFAYNAVDLLETYAPAAVAGTGATTYAYNLDRDLTSITRPDGKKINYGYDAAGRLSTVVTPNGNLSYTYDTTTGNLDSVARGTERITYNYNGPLPTKSTWKGTVAGSVGRSYNANFWLVSQNVGGGSTVSLAYDKDGLLTKAGAMVVKRSPKNGLVTGTTMGVTSDTRTYNTFGELITYTASVNGAAAYSETFTRDAGGRVASKTETIGAITNTYSYSYDLGGRLTAVTKNTATDSYTYDSNSNRLSAITPTGTTNGTYDAQDRLLTYGNTSYTYTANGELASAASSTQKTNYTYDVLGNLIGVTLPNGTHLSYVIDGQNRRVGKEVGGVLATGFLYDGEHVMAQLNGSNLVVSQFVYGTGSTSPAYMINGGNTYRIISDQLGSPILVVNTSTGTITEELTYDEFGNVLSDTNPGFQPFGFAGGLYDPDTKLLRFGARDYNPITGRWSAKDPTLFDGGDPNLYAYSFTDPVNWIDPLGTADQKAGAPNSQPTSEGTPDSPGITDKVDSWIEDTIKDYETARNAYGKCKKALKWVRALGDGTEGIAKGLQSEATGKIPTGGLDEQKQLLQDLHDKGQPAVQDYADKLVRGDAWRNVINATKPCPNKDCKAQTKAPDPRPPKQTAPSKPEQWQPPDY